MLQSIPKRMKNDEKRTLDKFCNFAMQTFHKIHDYHFPKCFPSKILVMTERQITPELVAFKVLFLLYFKVHCSIVPPHYA